MSEQIDRAMRAYVKQMGQESRERRRKILSGELPDPMRGLSSQFRNAAMRARKNPHPRLRHGSAVKTLLDETTVMEGG